MLSMHMSLSGFGIESCPLSNLGGLSWKDGNIRLSGTCLSALLDFTDRNDHNEAKPSNADGRFLFSLESIHGQQQYNLTIYTLFQGNFISH